MDGIEIDMSEIEMPTSPLWTKVLIVVLFWGALGWVSWLTDDFHKVYYPCTIHGTDISCNTQQYIDDTLNW